MNRFKILLFLFLSYFHYQGKTQINTLYNNDLQTEVLNQLVAEGFQSISIKQEGKIFFVAYENRVYRYEVNAIKQIIQLVAPLLVRDVEQLVIITRQQQIPIVSTQLFLRDYNDFMEGKINKTIFINRLQISQEDTFLTITDWQINNKNTGKFKLEIVIEPDLNLVLGGTPDPVLHQFNLIPTANLYLWKGAQFKFQGILPISNELGIPEETFVRPGILSFSQQVRLPTNLFVGISFGYYSEYRYGTSLDLTKYFINGNLALNGHLGYTGYASYPKRLGVENPEKVWQYGDWDYLDYKMGVSYFIPKWKVKMGVSYGKVLYNKKALHVSMTQQFKEARIEVFSFKTDNGYNYGVNLAIPIFSKKYWKPKVVSIKPASHLQYSYYFTQRYISEYNTGINSNINNQTFNPALLQYLLTREDWD